MLLQIAMKLIFCVLFFVSLFYVFALNQCIATLSACYQDKIYDIELFLGHVPYENICQWCYKLLPLYMTKNTMIYIQTFSLALLINQIKSIKSKKFVLDIIMLWCLQEISKLHK